MICTNIWGAVYENGTPEQKLECPNCGAQDSEIIERVPPKDKPITSVQAAAPADDVRRLILTPLLMGFGFAIGNALFNFLLSLTK